MSREREAVDDIERLLALTWRPWGTVPLDSDSITRTWSLDLGWLTPTSSEQLLAKLIAKGWLTKQSGDLLPARDLGGVAVPLGWFPRQRLLEEPPECPPDVNEVIESRIQPESEEVEGSVQEGDYSIESHSAIDAVDIPALLQAISTAAKLDRQEVMRRAQRKRRALGPVTVWMALSLVARELGLDVASLLED